MADDAITRGGIGGLGSPGLNLWIQSKPRVLPPATYSYQRANVRMTTALNYLCAWVNYANPWNSALLDKGQNVYNAVR